MHSCACKTLGQKPTTWFPWWFEPVIAYVNSHYIWSQPHRRVLLTDVVVDYSIDRQVRVQRATKVGIPRVHDQPSAQSAFVRRPGAIGVPVIRQMLMSHYSVPNLGPAYSYSPCTLWPRHVSWNVYFVKYSASC